MTSRLIAVFLLLASSAFAYQDPPDAGQPHAAQNQDPLARQMEQYPGLLDALAHLREKLSLEVQYPPLRSKSRLLPLVPASAVFYASFPNYGGALQQAHHVLRQELESNEDLRAWWQKQATSGSPEEFDEAIRGIVQVSEYLGDEIVVTTMFHRGQDSTVVIAEVRKPGLAAVLQQLSKRYSDKIGRAVRILTPEQLVSSGPVPKDATLVLVRPDFVVVAQKLADLKSFNARLSARAGEPYRLENTPFGQKIAGSYQAGVGVLAAADVKALMAESAEARKALPALKQTGFDDVKYVVAERRESQGEPNSSIELSFAGPRRGAASWLGAPAPADGMDFIAPDTTMALDLRLKDLSQVLNDVLALVDPGNQNFGAGLEMMQKQFNVNLREDLLGKLTGEVVIAVDPPSGGDGTPGIRAILGVHDADGLERTLKQAFTLMGGRDPDVNAPAVEQSAEGGVTYYSVRLSGAPKALRLHYAFVDNYLVLGMGRALVRDAIRFHRNGRSLAHSAEFRTALPRENNGAVSALMSQDYGRLLDLAGQMPPTQVSLIKIVMGQARRNFGWAIAGESSIRLVSSGAGSDVTTMSILAAVALPQVMRSRTAANESAAAQTVRVLTTHQFTYASNYPDKGFARSLAALGGGPACPKAPSARHACLLEGPLGDASCVVGAWCERDEFRFSISAEGCQSGPCTDFVVTATPATGKSGAKNYCATSDGVPRWRSGSPLSKPIGVDECLKWAPL